MREVAYLELLQTKGVDGIIFIATTAQIDQISPLVERGVPVVMFYRESGDLNVDTLQRRQSAVGYTAMEHLLQLGHREIACIQPASPQRCLKSRANAKFTERGTGFIPALPEAEVSTYSTEFWRESGLFKHPLRPASSPSLAFSPLPEKRGLPG